MARTSRSAHAKAALVVDNPKRDLAGLVLVAHELAKLGVEPYLVPMYQQGYDVPLIAPDAVLVNYARTTNRALLAGYRALGARVIVMDTEGGVLSESGVDSPANWAQHLRESGLDANLDRYLFWGSRVRGAFAEAGVLPDERLELTGCPRYDYCHARWSGLLAYPERGFILVNTNFSAINPQFTRSAEDEMAIFQSTGWPREYVLALFEDLRAVFPRYLDAVAGMAKRNPQRRIVVRPHPFEDATVYQRRYAEIPNVTVDGAGNVLNVLNAADCMVHLNCGSSVETVLLGKTPISLEYLNTERMRSHASLPSSISCHARDEGDLDRLVNTPSERAQRWDAAAVRARYIEPWFYVIDGGASARTAAAIAATVNESPRRVRTSLARSAAGGVTRPSRGQLAQGLASHLVGSHAVAALRARVSRARRHKTFSPSEVSGLLRRLAQVDGAPRALRAERARHPLTGAPLSSLKLSFEAAR
ncbi:MAG TPA: surface carbohydrate biosynthesis protein [Burkholderiales bacterium]|nr:surface carbohydrate biosynthesis protein [Burkholderiales bacterium]